ncbi:MAG: hypothetical protein U9R27_03330 [Campylobacterota bacterium]|nr:hypothetical protein [Campylobacterota bacterium]
MAIEITKRATLLDLLAIEGKSTLSDRQKVAIAKKSYLINNRSDLLQAIEVGYRFTMIAKVATSELLSGDVPKNYPVQKEGGDKILKETRFTVAEIKQFCSQDPQENEIKSILPD